MYHSFAEHENEHLPHPLPADVWLWQVGDQWIAQTAAFNLESWWDGADEKDIATRPEQWWYPIGVLPTWGTLMWLDEDGATQKRELGGRPEPKMRHNYMPLIQVFTHNGKIEDVTILWDDSYQDSFTESHQRMDQYGAPGFEISGEHMDNPEVRAAVEGALKLGLASR